MPIRPTLLLLFAMAIFGALLGTAWLYQQGQMRLREPLSLNEPLLYVVTPGSTLTGVANDLHSKGVLAEPKSLLLYARINEKASVIKAGEYAIAPGTTPIELLNQFVEGTVVQRKFTVVEGWTFRQLLAAIANSKELVHTLDGMDPEEIMAKLGHAGEHPEGRFFADTYSFPRGTTDLEFLSRAYATMAARLKQSWRDRSPDVPLKTPYEALILASIVEKETGRASERAQIAGVFARRLERGMRLETDPTIIYGLGDAFDGNLKRIHLRTDGPYNSYTRHGLPPTPIALPGAAAIDAVLHPAPGGALFFVAKGNGTHYFSATYAEHKRAVEKYQLRQRK